MCVRIEKSIAAMFAAGVTYPTTLNGCVRAIGVELGDAVGATATEQPMSTSARATALDVARTKRRISAASSRCRGQHAAMAQPVQTRQRI